MDVTIFRTINLPKLLEEILSPGQLLHLQCGPSKGEFTHEVYAKVKDLEEPETKVKPITSADLFDAIKLVKDEAFVENPHTIAISALKIITESVAWADSEEAKARACYAADSLCRDSA